MITVRRSSVERVMARFTVAGAWALLFREVIGNGECRF